MDDLIKRSDVWNITAILHSEFITIEQEQILERIDEMIDNIPSADRPQGVWIFKPLFPNDKSEFPMGHLECSVCGSHHSNSLPCNYCDNCGARMKGADDE